METIYFKRRGKREKVYYYYFFYKEVNNGLINKQSKVIAVEATNLK